jgi:hypothetical protein
MLYAIRSHPIFDRINNRNAIDTGSERRPPLRHEQCHGVTLPLNVRSRLSFHIDPEERDL